MGNYSLRFNFVCKLQCFQGFLRRKRVLVLNLVEIFKEFLIFMSILLKIIESLRAWTRPREHLLCYYMRNFCNLIGLEQWDFSLI